MTVAVILPMLVSVGLATVVYGGLPDLRVVGTFLGLFVALPAFYIALTVALGAGVKSTVGVAGIAFAVMFLPQVLGGLLPIVNELSPTSIGIMGVARRQGPACIDAHADRLGDLDDRPARSGRSWCSTARSSDPHADSTSPDGCLGRAVRRFRFVTT